MLICIASSSSEPPKQLPEFTAAQSLMQKGGSAECLVCPPECADCEDGVATLHKAWRLNTPTDQLLKTALRGAAGGLPLVAFRCPYGGNDCPPIPLGPGSATGPSAGRNSSVQCLTNHTGTLCAECQDGFSRKGASDNRCNVCTALAHRMCTL